MPPVVGKVRLEPVLVVITSVEAADKNAAGEAEKDRRELLDLKGLDANQSEAKVELIDKRLRESGSSSFT